MLPESTNEEGEGDQEHRHKISEVDIEQLVQACIRYAWTVQRAPRGYRETHGERRDYGTCTEEHDGVEKPIWKSVLDRWDNGGFAWVEGEED